MSVSTRYRAAASAFEEALENLDLPPDSLEGEAAQREIGRRAAMLATAELQWSDHLGPLLGWKDVASILKSVGTRQGVNDLARRGRLLGLPSSDGQLLYPLFQFRNSRPFPELPKIIETFGDTGLDPWTLGSWMVTPQSELDGATPVEWLNDARPAEQVVEAARRTAFALER